MSLGRKTVWLFLGLGLAFSLVSYVILKWTVFPLFHEFDRESTEAALTRVSQALEADLSALKNANIELSRRDLTYEFAQGRRPEFADKSIVRANRASRRLHMVLIFNANGERLYAELTNPDADEPLSVEQEFESPLVRDHVLVTHQSPGDSISGLLRTRSGIMQVASYPILTDEAGGPVAGSVVVGRYFTHQRMLAIEQRTMASVYLLDDATPRPTTSTHGPHTENGAMRVVETTGIASFGFKPLRDLYGNTVANLRVHTPKRVTRVGAEITEKLTLLLVVLTAIFLVSTLLFVRRLIIAPLTKLTSQILTIRQTGNLQFDVDRWRRDEVGVLGGEFAAMAEQLQRGRMKLEKARDDALAISKAKSEFLARMSHEIRTPMNGVLGMTELLRSTPLKPKQRKFADTIYSSAESLLNVINDILDFSKMEAGKLNLEIVDVHLRAVIEETVDSLASQAHAKNIELMTMVPPGLNKLVKTDPVRLRQVITNLVSNAIKFTHDGEVLVKLSVEERLGDYETIRFEVHDTGIGIAPEEQQQIFESFTQADGSITRLYGGSGLGLAICKQLVEQMGGELKVSSHPSDGSVFSFRLRMHTSHFVAAGECTQMPRLSDQRVLIVDDNATNRDILEHQLDSWRALVGTASSAGQAYEKLVKAAHNNTPYDLVLLDRHMPLEDGLELARTIRASAALSTLKIIILSSVASQIPEDDMRELNIAGQLCKPVKHSQLFDTLARVMRGEEDRSQFEPVFTASQQLQGRVLLVEDNHVNRQVAFSMLEKFGLQVVLASDGLEAVEKFSSEPIDLILMDCQLPVMDGLKATETIRLIEAETDRSRTPIVAATANALERDKEEALCAGMDDWLTKPFTGEQLHALLSLYLPLAQRVQAADLTSTTVLDQSSMGFEETDSALNKDGEVDAAIDRSTLKRLQQLQQPGAPDLLRKILNLYLSSSSVIKEKLSSAIESENAVIVRETAHALKSSSMNIGATQLASFCKRLEVMGRDNTISADPSLKQTLEFEYDRVVCELEIELGGAR
ncbi:MAG: response regulator [Pseudomonadota bacterium]